MTKYWGYSNFFMSFGVALGSLLGAFLYKHYGSSIILIIECVIISICIILISTIPNIQIPKSEPKLFSESIKKYINLTKNICKNRAIIYFVLYSGLLNSLSYLFALGFQPILKNALFPVIIFGVISFINYFIKSCAGIVVGKWLKTVNVKKLVIPLFILYLIGFYCILTSMCIKNQTIIFALLTVICLIIGAQIAFLILHISRLHKLVPANDRGSLMTINNNVSRLLPAVFLVLSKIYLEKSDVFIFFVVVFVFYIIFGSYLANKAYGVED